MARYDLSEVEWSIIEPLLPPAPPGKQRVDDRRVLNGIFWVLRTGSPWRDLPARYGPSTTVYNRYNRWSQKGIWQYMFAELTAAFAGTPEQVSIDSTHVKAHRSAAGGKGGLLLRRLASPKNVETPRSTP